MNTKDLEVDELARIVHLLDILEGCRGLPKLKPIHDEAMNELEALAIKFKDTPPNEDDAQEHSHHEEDE